MTPDNALARLEALPSAQRAHALAVFEHLICIAEEPSAEYMPHVLAAVGHLLDIAEGQTAGRYPVTA